MIPQPRGPSAIATHNHTDTINVLPSPQLDDDIPLLDLSSGMTIDKIDHDFSIDSEKKWMAQILGHVHQAVEKLKGICPQCNEIPRVIVVFYIYTRGK